MGTTTRSDTTATSGGRDTVIFITREGQSIRSTAVYDLARDFRVVRSTARKWARRFPTRVRQTPERLAKDVVEPPPYRRTAFQVDVIGGSTVAERPLDNPIAC